MGSNIEWVVESVNGRKELAETHARMTLFLSLEKSAKMQGIWGKPDEAPGEAGVWQKLADAERQYMERIVGELILLERFLEEKHDESGS